MLFYTRSIVVMNISPISISPISHIVDQTYIYLSNATDFVRKFFYQMFYICLWVYV